jgi:hypothetical protein
MLILLEALSFTSAKARMVKVALIRELSRRFETIFLNPEYFLAVATNPVTKNVLNSFKSSFLKSVTDTLQRDIDSCNHSESVTSSAPSPLQTDLWFMTGFQNSTVVTNIKHLIEEWMELPINAKTAVCIGMLRD